MRSALTDTLVVASLLLTCLGLVSGCRGQVSENTPIHLNPNMDQQPRYDPQENSELFEDRRAMRTPVEGTVHHGWLFDKDETTEQFYEGTLHGEVINELPPVDDLHLDAALVDRGRDRYDVFCTPCHGAAGEGNGIVVSLGMLPPPSFHQERVRSEPLGHLYRVMTYGVSGGQVGAPGFGGKPTMPPYQSQVPAYDRWAIATYVRALQVTTLAGTDLGPAAVEPEPSEGEDE